MRNAGLVVLAALAALSATVPAVSASLDGLPKTTVDAITLYEGDADRWLEGPVQYLILDSEREAFNALSTSSARRRFIADFWARRDLDRRDRVNPFRTGFYARVAEANARYRNFPRGWRSDRGRVHVVLGRPDYVSAGSPTGPSRIRTWTYYSIGPRGNDRPFGTTRGELQLSFVQDNRRQRWRVVDDIGIEGAFPYAVLEAMEFARQAAVDPALRRRTVE